MAWGLAQTALLAMPDARDEDHVVQDLIAHDIPALSTADEKVAGLFGRFHTEFRKICKWFNAFAQAGDRACGAGRAPACYKGCKTIEVGLRRL